MTPALGNGVECGMSNQVSSRGCTLDRSEESLVLGELATWDRSRAMEIKAQGQRSKKCDSHSRKEGLQTIIP